MKRRLLITFVLMLSLLTTGAWAQWSEPTISPILMTAPLTPPPVTGTTFYVDKGSIGGTCNNSNAGTISAPWCTIGKAMTTLTAGQRAYVRAGTYNEGDLHPTNSGTAGNYITLQAYPSESPVINCAANIFCWDGDNFDWSYVVWNGFEAHSPIQQHYVQDSTSDHHIWFVNGKYHNSSTQSNHNNAGFVFGGNFNVISNNEAYNHPVHFAGANGHNNIFEFNIVHDNGWNGDDEGAIKCGAGSAYNCIIRYNTGYNNFRDTTRATAPCFSGVTCQGITAFYIDIGRDNENGGMSYFYNNIAFDNDIGIQIYETHGMRAFNNLTYRNGWVNANSGFVSNFGHGITIESTDLLNVQVYNNTSYNNLNRGINFGGASPGTVISRNNLSMNNGIDFAAYIGANGDFNYDLMFNNVGGTLIVINGVSYSTLSAVQARPGNTTWLNAVHANPLFVNSSGADFHLQSSSPAVGAGTTGLVTFDLDNVTRPVGGTWDIGAYEASSSVIVLTPPTNLRVVSP